MSVLILFQDLGFYILKFKAHVKESYDWKVAVKIVELFANMENLYRTHLKCKQVCFLYTAGFSSALNSNFVFCIF